MEINARPKMTPRISWSAFVARDRGQIGQTFRRNPEIRWSRCQCCFIFASDAFPYEIASRQFHQHLSEVLALEELEEGSRRIFDALARRRPKGSTPVAASPSPP